MQKRALPVQKGLGFRAKDFVEGGFSCQSSLLWLSVFSLLVFRGPNLGTYFSGFKGSS